MTTFNTTLTPTKQNYAQGEQVRIDLTGNATGNPVVTNMNATMTLEADDGTTVQGSGAFTITSPGLPQNVKIKAGTVSDGTARVYTVAADGKSVTATA